MSETDPPEFPEWFGKAIGIVALLVLLLAVLAAASFLIPRILGL